VERFGKPAVAELVGTFVFFFIGAGSIVTNQYNHGQLGLLGIALAHGLAIAVMITVFGPTSGGHFNPAVTLSFLATRRITAALAGVYILAQLTGGVLAGLVLRAVFTESVWGPVHLGTPYLASGVSFDNGVLIEAWLTGFLVLSVFGTAVDARAPRIGGFGIGLMIMVDILMGGPLTGASMNPARTFGPALASWSWDNDLVYWIGPIIGGVIAALVYEYVILHEPREA
jgi:MIP family channel proteins